MSEQPKCPERVAGPPIRFVAVKDAGGVWRDSATPAQFGEFIRLNVVTNDRVLEVGALVYVYGAGNVPCVVEENVFV